MKFMRGRSRVGLVALTLAASLALTACGGEAKQAQPENSSAAATATDPKDYPGTEKGPWEDAEGLPAVTGAFGKEPTIKPGKGEAPKELMKRVLAKGKGPAVKASDILVVNYHGQLWNGKVFDSSFKRGGPAVFELQGLVEGWKQGLTGAHAGDRIELVVPPKLGYGEKATQAIPANSTLVFVLDIINRVDPSDLSALKSAKPVSKEQLPEGIKVSGEPGQKPTVEVSDPKLIKEPKRFVVLEGTGRPIDANDTLVIHETGKEPATSTDYSSYDQDKSGKAILVPGPLQNQPQLLQIFTGVRVGSRIVYLMPAQEATGGARVLVLDVVNAISTK